MEIASVPRTRKESHLRVLGFASISCVVLIIAQLLYVWHHEKKKQPNLSWGDLAPIPLDTLSKFDREHACETIKAYCVKHSLNLVALISLPFVPPNHDSTRNIEDLQSPSRPPDFLPLIFAKEELWQEVMECEVSELVALTRDYIEMLQKASGRVVVVSGGISDAVISLNRTTSADLKHPLHRRIFATRCDTKGSLSAAAFRAENYWHHGVLGLHRTFNSDPAMCAAVKADEV